MSTGAKTLTPEEQALIEEHEWKAIVAKVANLNGNFVTIPTHERTIYYNRLCALAGLDPATLPFCWLENKNRAGDINVTLYAKRGATDQLAMRYEISITALDEHILEDMVIVKAYGKTKGGRQGANIGATALYPNSSAKDKANAVMSASTKAQRRLVISMSGLFGVNDESEVEDTPQLTPLPTCEECKNPIEGVKAGTTLFSPQDIQVRSLQTFKRSLCWNCATIAKKAAETEKAATTIESPSEPVRGEDTPLEEAMQDAPVIQ